MNFLAHLYLSPPTADARLGSLLGDFVKGPVERAGYNTEISAAIRLHRAIDTFTDAHPAVLRAKARMPGQRRRYAGILVDIFFDHYLARDWTAHHPATLASFAAEVYASLEAPGHALPARFDSMVSHMIRHDWLGSYRRIEGIETALDRMCRRMTRGAEALQGSAEELVRNYDALQADFAAFFPDLRTYVTEMLSGAAPSRPVQPPPASARFVSAPMLRPWHTMENTTTE